MSGFSGVAPTAILQQALSSFEGGAGAIGEQGQIFIASKTWQGRRPGYYFGKGVHGLGYYADAGTGSPEVPNASDDSNVDEPPGPSARQPLLTPEELLEQAEAAAAASGDRTALETVDARDVRRMVATLERKATHNLEQRTRHADQPERFLESEVELDDAINALRVVASTPELYPELAASGFPATAAALLGHDNADIAAAVVELLSELMAEDAAGEAPQAGATLAAALAAAGVPAALTARLRTFDPAVPEEAAAAGAALGVLAAALECDPEQAGVTAQLPGLLPVLLAALKPARAALAAPPGTQTDVVREAAGQLLGTLVQDSSKAKHAAVEAGAVDAILQALAPLRRGPPADADEAEHLETLFTALCSLLMIPAGQAAFLDGEGVELMELILRGRHGLRCAVLRCLDFATTGSEPACKRLVDGGGLRHLFGVFMGKLKRGKGVDEAEQEEEEERVVSIIASLLQMLPDSPARDRVASKFVEAEFEKVDRLLEIFLRYHDRVAASDARLARAAGEESVDEEELLLGRLDSGLHTLQQAAIIVGLLWLLGESELRKRVLMLLHQRSKSLATLREALAGRVAVLGADGPAEEAQRQRRAINTILRALGHQGEDEAAAAADDGPDDVGDDPADSRQQEQAGGESKPATEPAALGEHGQEQREGGPDDKSTEAAQVVGASGNGAPPASKHTHEPSPESSHRRRSKSPSKNPHRRRSRTPPSRSASPPRRRSRQESRSRSPAQSKSPDRRRTSVSPSPRHRDDRSRRGSDDGDRRRRHGHDDGDRRRRHGSDNDDDRQSHKHRDNNDDRRRRRRDSERHQSRSRR